MALITLINSVLSMICGYQIAKYLKHWSAYIVAVLAGPVIGVLASISSAYLLYTGELDIGGGFLQRLLGQSVWVGLAFTVAGLIYGRAKYNSNQTAPENSRFDERFRSPIVTPPPFSTNHAKSANIKEPSRPDQLRTKTITNRDTLLQAYGKVLIKYGNRPSTELRDALQRSDADAALVAVQRSDSFALAGGRSVKLLPASKATLEDILRSTLLNTPDANFRETLKVAFLELATFQDEDWCHDHGVNPTDLMLSETERLMTVINEIEKRIRL
jgi:hypothetical protein